MTVTFNTKVRDHHWEANQLTLEWAAFVETPCLFHLTCAATHFPFRCIEGLQLAWRHIAGRSQILNLFRHSLCLRRGDQGVHRLVLP